MLNLKKKNSPTECFKLLTEVYGGITASRTRVFERHERFSGGRKEVDDDEHPGRPSTSKTDKNVEKVNEIVRNYRRVSIRMIGNMVNIDKETVRQISHDKLNMKKSCAKTVSKNLTREQKDNSKVICSDILQRLDERPNLLENVITCDETWIFQYDPETKRQ